MGCPIECAIQMKAVKGKRASNFTNKRLDKESEEGEKRVKAKWDTQDLYIYIYTSRTFIMDINNAHIVRGKNTH